MDYIKADKPTNNINLIEDFIFPTAIYRLTAEDVAKTVDRNAIVDFIQKRRTIDSEGRERSNYRGWQSNDLVEDSLKSPDLLKLWDTVINSTKAIGVKQQLAEFYQHYIGSSWANINESHIQHNVNHCHPQTYYASIYYAQAAEGHGALVLQDPRPAAAFSINHSKELDARYNMPSINIDPVEGDLLLIPGWLFHCVLPNDNQDVERIVIASNVVLRE